MILHNKILLLSADNVTTRSITACLTEGAFKVVHSSLGLGAIERIHNENPALIILDIDLPDFNSLAIIRLLRGDDLYRKLPVILLGATLTEEDVLIGLEVGADLCLLETFNPQVFLARVRSLLRRSELVKTI